MSDPIMRLNAALEGRYRIEHELGEGATAVVYLARDVRHDRRVAIKVLKPELAAVVGAERFLTEIRTTAGLQHPHVLSLHDSGEAGGFLFYVMPHIEGESLRDRLRRETQLPVQDAIDIAVKVAAALDYAHRQGVIHRDIKPENILLHEGNPLVADFGIALALSVAEQGRMTETGLSLGTPHYMSPEQATAERDLSVRSDVYSLACVLYEMLAGVPPHEGPNAQAVLAKIVTEDPRAVTELRRAVPENVAAALARGLEKLPADRFENAAAFGAALEDKGFTYRVPAGPTATASGKGGAALSAQRDPRLVPLAVIAALAVAVAAWALLGRVDSPPAPVTRGVVDLGDIQLLLIDEVIVSPDGSRLAVTGSVDGQRGLFVRNADEDHFRPLLQIGGPSYPAFSPDSDWIVYYDNSDDSLMKIALSGGPPRTIVPPSSNLDPTMPHWGDDGTIVFYARNGGIYRVPDTGGEATLVVRGEYSHPRLLPGGRGVLMTAGNSVRYLDLTDDTIFDLIPGGVDARYVHTGHILYVDAAGGLWAVPFDVDRGAVIGAAVPILDGITVSGSFARYAVSANGTLVYAHSSDGTGSGQEVLIVSMSGDETVPPLGPGANRQPRWSPDGSSMAYTVRMQGWDPNERSIYVIDLEQGTAPRRLTFGDNDIYPVWSPDGQHIAFIRGRSGSEGGSLFVKEVHGDAPPRLILGRAGRMVPTQWTDGGDLLYGDGEGDTELWTMQMSDSTSAATYLTSERQLRNLSLSPRGDFAVYLSGESGGREVFVRSYPVPRQQVTISQGEGAYPRWSPDGTRIYYWKANTPGLPDSLFAVTVRYEPAFAVLSREPVLSGEYIVSGWDLHPDGDRFVVLRDAAGGGVTEGGRSGPERHTVVTNWFEELRPALAGSGEHE